MTWGQGLGPWDGTPLALVDDQVSEVAGDPITFDMSDEPDGPLPGMWETYVLDADAVGDVAVAAEGAPSTYYRVVGGLALWDYARSPVAPGPGVPFQERGVSAGPAGVLVGRNARLSAILVPPTSLLDDLHDDELVYEVVLGVRFTTAPYGFVGGRVRAGWAAGAWTTPMALEAVQAVGQAPTVLSAAVFDALPDPTDRWLTAPRAELTIEMRGDTLAVSLNGVWHTSATVLRDGPAKPVVEMRAYTRRAAVLSAHPVLSALQLRSLRDLEHLGPGPQLPGDVKAHEHPTIPMIQVPLQGLLDADPPFLKRVGSRRFQAVREFVVEVDANHTWVREGEVLHAREPFVGQALVPVTRDLAFERERGGR